MFRTLPDLVVSLFGVLSNITGQQFRIKLSNTAFSRKLLVSMAHCFELLITSDFVFINKPFESSQIVMIRNIFQIIQSDRYVKYKIFNLFNSFRNIIISILRFLFLRNVSIFKTIKLSFLFISCYCFSFFQNINESITLSLFTYKMHNKNKKLIIT